MLRRCLVQVHHGSVKLAPRQPSTDEGVSGDLPSRIAVDIVAETVDECERLLLEAEEAAGHVRRAAEEDAAQLRRNAVRASTRLVDEMEQRRPQVTAVLTGAKALAEQATAITHEVVADAERRASELVGQAEARARAITGRAEADRAVAAGRIAAAEVALREAEARERQADERLAEADARIASADARLVEAEALLREGTEAIAAAEASRALLDDRSRAIEEQSAGMERRVAALHTEIAAAEVQSRETVDTAQAWATQHRAKTEGEALRLLEEAWRSSSALQLELIDEAEAEAREVIGRATRDADRMRKEAEHEAAALRATPRREVDLLDGPDVDRSPSVDVVPEPEPLAPVAGASRARRVVQLSALVLVILLGAWFLRAQVGTPYTIESGSMSPELVDGERVLVNKIVYDLRAPHRGDIVVVEAGADRDDTVVKRVVGLPGETIAARGGEVLVNGRPLSEPYLGSDVSTSTFAPIELRADEVFVLGDNRGASSDSRVFGPVRLDELVGRAEAVVWPPGGLRRI